MNHNNFDMNVNYVNQCRALCGKQVLVGQTCKRCMECYGGVQTDTCNINERSQNLRYTICRENGVSIDVEAIFNVMSCV